MLVVASLKSLSVFEIKFFFLDFNEFMWVSELTQNKSHTHN